MDGGSQGPQRAPQQASPQAINLAHSFGREPQEGVVMKPTVNRLLARLAMFAVAIVLGAIAVAQAHKGLKARQEAGTELAAISQTDEPMAQPIPLNAADPGDPAGTAYGEPSGNQYEAADPYGSPEAYGTPDGYGTNGTPDAYASPDGYGTGDAYGSSDNYGTGDAYGPGDVDPGFDEEPVDYQDTPAYAAAANEASPEPPMEPYGDPAAEYGAPTPAQDGATEMVDPYGAPPPPLAGAAAAVAPAADFAMRNNAEPAAMPADAYGDPVPDAQQVQFTEGVPNEAQDAMALDSGPGYGSDEPDPGYFPDTPATASVEPSQTFPPHEEYDGAASLAIGDTRTRSAAPSFEPQANANPAFADPSLATPPAAFADSGFAATSPPLATPSTGKGKPGPQELEGTQAPSLTLSKTSPAEVQVGKPATFTITVRNVGQVAAHDVLIRDEVPHGARLIDTSPTSKPTADGAILWEMGTIQAGAQVTASMEIVPTDEGEIGSVATVSFQASASAKSVSTRPQLELQHTTDRQVLIGNDVIFRIQLTNSGTGAATGVRIEEDVPSGLRHFEGRELEFEVGTIRPQETRVLELKLKADQPGPVTNLLIARGEGEIEVRDECELEVVAPALQVAVDGPRKRFLERQATHKISIANPGTAPAHNVDLVARLPRALKFVNTNNAGQYDSQAHAVRWSLNELPAQEMGTVELTTTPTEIGEHGIQVTTRADMGLEDAAEHHISVDGLAALLFTVTDVSDPIEVGGQTTYEVQVVNQGSKAATNLKLVALIPPGMQPLNGDGPTRAVVEGQKVVFDQLARLAPQSDSFYKIHVKGVMAGDQRIKVAIISDELREPVTKEESTHVYADDQ
ncbi:MAG: hypothetical protein AAGF97_12915 [Planctomycetota bacterium]